MQRAHVSGLRRGCVREGCFRPIAADEALALCVINDLGGDSGQVQRGQGGGVQPLQGSNNVPRHIVSENNTTF